MKKLLLIIMMLLAVNIAYSSSCVDEEEEKRELTFTIKFWQQEYYEYSASWSMVSIYFEVKNTGTIDVDFYYVYFEVTSYGELLFHDYTCDYAPNVGRIYSGWTVIDTAGYEALTVEITGYDMESW